MRRFLPTLSHSSFEPFFYNRKNINPRQLLQKGNNLYLRMDKEVKNGFSPLKTVKITGSWLQNIFLNCV